MVNNCTLALKIDAESSKALYRRSYALFAKKDHDRCKDDLLKAQEGAPGDKAVATLLKKVNISEVNFSSPYVIALSRFKRPRDSRINADRVAWSLPSLLR